MRIKLILLAGCLISCGILFGIWKLYEDSYGRLNSELKLLKAAGEPTEWEQVIPSLPPERENAAPVYRLIFDRLRLTDDEDQLLGRAASRRPHNINRNTLGNIVRANAEALSMIATASERSRSIFQVDWSNPAGAPMPHLTKLRKCSRLLAAAALVKKWEGKQDISFEFMQSNIKMAKQISREDPGLIPFLVRASLRSIALSNLIAVMRDQEAQESDYKTMLKQLAGWDVKQELVRTLVTERTFQRRVYQKIREGKTNELDESIPYTEPNLVSHWFFTRDEAFYLEAMRRMIRIARAKGYQWDNIRNEGFSEVAERNGYKVAAIMLPLYFNVIQKAAYGDAEIALARLAITLRLYRIDHGSYPQSLNVLAPRYLSEVPVDPFTGKSFVYRVLRKGFIVYSLGPNRTDNTGTYNPKDWQSGDLPWRSTI